LEKNKEELKENYAGQIVKRIEKTTFIVNMYFSETSKETIQDKILKLVRNDMMNNGNL